MSAPRSSSYEFLIAIISSTITCVPEITSLWDRASVLLHLHLSRKHLLLLLLLLLLEPRLSGRNTTDVEAPRRERVGH